MVEISKPIKGLSALILATSMYGFFGILSRWVGYSIPLFYQNLIRSLIVVGLFGIYMLVKKGWIRIKPQVLLWLSVRSLAGTIAFITFFIAMNEMQISTAYFVFYVGCVIGGYTLGMLLFKEKITRIKIISFVIALAGLAVIFKSGLEFSSILWVVMAIISGLSTSVWNIVAKKIPETYSISQISVVDNVFAAGFSIIGSLVLKEIWIMPEFTQPWLANYALAFFWTLTPILVITGFRSLDASVGSVVMLMEIVFASLWAFLLFGEGLTPLTFFGGILIIAAIIIPEYRPLLGFIKPLFQKSRRKNG